MNPILKTALTVALAMAAVYIVVGTTAAAIAAGVIGAQRRRMRDAK